MIIYNHDLAVPLQFTKRNALDLAVLISDMNNNIQPFSFLT